MTKVIPKHEIRFKADETGPVHVCAPGKPVELPEDVAASLLHAGAATPYAAEDVAAVSDRVEPSDPTADASSIPDDLMEAVMDLSEDEASCNADGKPKVEVLAARLGRPVSAAERDAAFAALES